MLSQTCKIAIKSVIHLSCQCQKGRKTGVKEVAEKINASEHTVGKALQLLVKKGIIKSLKGPNGGFFLTEKQQDQPLIKIVETIDGPDTFKTCGLGITKCSDDHPCPIHDDYKVARQLIEKIFKEKKIKDLRNPVNEGLAFLNN